MRNDDFDDSEERFGGRKDRRRPKRGRRRSELLSEPGEASDGFADSGLESLARKGHLLELGQQVRGGKEATVYRATGPDGALAAKVYSDEEAGGFRADEVYRSGRYIPDRRLRKMLGNARRRGLSPELAHWVYHEYRMLWLLQGEGIRAPRPALGPEPDEIVEAGRVVLMEWIGDEEPAPRLADARLEQEEVQQAWSQARRLFFRLLELGLVHGDLSTFNLLWWRQEVILIDVPQMVEAERNPHAGELLDRDARSLCSSFRSMGVEEDPANLALEARLAAGQPPSGPLRSPRPPS